MNIFQATVLGIIQGLTEFLPVSSSGHLIIFPTVFGWEVQSLAFDVVLHLGTATALIAYFWKDILNIVSKDRKLGLYIIVGSIPAAIAGLFLEDYVSNIFRSVYYVLAFLLVGSVIMFISEKVGNWAKNREVGMKEGLIIGIFQALALFPGVSRSGSTLSGGMLLGLSRENAARFSFLLSIPVVLGAGFLELSKVSVPLNGVSNLVLGAGFVSSFIAGTLAIKFMLNFLKNNTLKGFIVYRIILVLVLLGLFGM
jgi:undecaprenyl-diphosphatase